MEVRPHDFPSIRTSDVFRTFANRLARLALLRTKCEDDHPVLAVERDLVEMARSKLQEHVMVRVTGDSRRLFRPLLESWVRSAAMERALAFDEEDSVKEAVLTSLRSEESCDVIPEVH